MHTPAHTLKTPRRTVHRTVHWLSAATLAVALGACGGGGSNNPDGTVGGTVSGLAAGTSVTIQNNGSETLTLTSNAPYTFTTLQKALTSFSVGVITQPVGQTCGITFPAGVIPTDGTTVRNVNVVCAQTSSVGGTVTGLTSGSSVTLALGDLSVVATADGRYSFPVVYAAGTAYTVAVSTQPTTQTCILTNATGTTASGVQSQVGVSCQ